ncbi:hypothetical protein [Nocardia carnea]|uniref:hypothetical protein n=1 Tax=Nocardia carnea TaxID=37328 RepID=UPI00245404AD|nr:hypothetical protein [Nocardia carnea]
MLETTTPAPSPEVMTALTNALNPQTVTPAQCALAAARLSLVASQAATTLLTADIPTTGKDAALTAAQDAAALAERLKNLGETLVAGE